MITIEHHGARGGIRGDTVVQPPAQVAAEVKFGEKNGVVQLHLQKAAGRLGDATRETCIVALPRDAAAGIQTRVHPAFIENVLTFQSATQQIGKIDLDRIVGDFIPLAALVVQLENADESLVGGGG